MRRVLPDGMRLGLAICGLLVVLSVIGHWMWSDIQSELTSLRHLIILDDGGSPAE